MKLWTREDSRKVDTKAATLHHIPVSSLMENAGSCVSRFVSSLNPKKVVIFCGKGNNGGDGFVAARHLSAKCDVTVCVLAKREQVSSACMDNLIAIETMGIDVTFVPSHDECERVLVSVDVIVDAILGVGYTGEELRDGISDVIALTLAYRDKAKIVSVDIPTGVEPNTGRIPYAAIYADYTIAFGRPKIGCLVYPGALASGKIIVEEIGLPQSILDCDGKIFQSTEKDMIRLVPKRSVDAHKGDFGRVAVVAGSKGMMGAVAFACRASMLSGCGLTYLISPGTHYFDVEGDILDVVKYDTAQNDMGRIAYIEPSILDRINSCDALAIGPGLGLDEDVEKVVFDVLKNAYIPVVIDADAINALANNTGVLASREPETSIITPHHMELSRLLDVPVDEIQRDVLFHAMKASDKYGCITVLKGAHTVIAKPGGVAYINPTGNSGMAKAGSGDILTGIIASLLAQGLVPYDAAVLGVYVHGLAGDLAAEQLSVRSMTAQDTLSSIVSAFSKLC